MNEIHSLKNSNCISPKNIIMKKVKNLKQNINHNNSNRYSLFHSNLSKPKKSGNKLVHKISNYNNNQKSKQNFEGKTAKVSPINFHNKIIGYININKINSSIPTMILNLNNKKYHLEVKKNKIFNEQTIPCILNLKNILNFVEIDANKKEKDIHNEIVKKIKEIDSLKKFVTLD